MATRFEVTLEGPGQFLFVLRAPNGSVLLNGLTGSSKIMVQNEILHLRKALNDPGRIVSHEAGDGSHFVVVKDKDGSVLARSPHLGSRMEVDQLMATIQSAAAAAPIVDLAKRAHAG